jgi:site-specific recombinase XerD
MTQQKPARKPFANFREANRVLLESFEAWLSSGGYSRSTRSSYAVAARSALEFLNKPHWAIRPEVDLERARARVVHQDHLKGLKKFAEFLNEGKPVVRRVNWAYHLNGLPEALHGHVREFAAHRQKNWRMEDRFKRTLGLVSQICTTLRGMNSIAPLKSVADLTPQLWFTFLDAQMAEDYAPSSINCRLSHLQAFLRFLEESGVPICARMLLVQPLKTGPRLPRDAPISDLRLILKENEREAQAGHAFIQRLGIMDRAWIHFMLYSGLRSCEVRRLQMEDINFENKRLRIEQSKGLKDRMVYMNSASVTALQTWLAVRETLKPPSNHVFFHRRLPLTPRYAQVRLRTYGKRCGVDITPHQLRHSCATLLLNAGAPALSVQSLLGHERLVSTTEWNVCKSSV